MARGVKEIKDSMTSMFVGDTNIRASYDLDASKTFDEQFSVVSIESILFYVVAFCAWTLEKLFDTHRNDMETLYSEHHAHTFNWYNNKAKAFMYGYPLIPFTSNYDATGLTDEEIAGSHIITHASCVKNVNANGVSFLRLKVAKTAGGELRALSDLEMSAFSDYVAEIQDAGVNVVCTSNEADAIRMRWTVYYDPQILDGAGNRLDGAGSDVVRGAIKAYVQALPFNGLYKLTYHIDALQSVEGVTDAYINEAWTHPELSSIYVAVQDDGVVADAGYFKFYNETELVVEMKAFVSN
jgi:hypothetical protein